MYLTMGITTIDKPRQIIEPANGIDILLYGSFLQHIVTEVEDFQAIVDKHSLW